MTHHDEPEQHEVPFDDRESNPNGGGPQGLTGDMGVSSERTGPEGRDPRGGSEFAGTGSHGGAVDSTDGTKDVAPTEHHDDDIFEEVARDNMPAPFGEGSKVMSDGVDRTVGEPLPAGIDEEKNRR